MAGRGNGRFGQLKNIVVNANRDGSRSYYSEHDDRAPTTNSNYRGKTEYRGGGNYRGRGGDDYRGHGRGGGNPRYRDHWDGDRSARVPEGDEGYRHKGKKGNWRGSARGGHRQNRMYKGTRPKALNDEDIDMNGGPGRERNRHQNMHKARGRYKKVNHPQRQKDQNNLGWHKIIIREGVNYERQLIQSKIQSLVEEQFTPICVDLEHRDLVFFLEDNGTAARAISDLSHRISMPDGKRLNIVMNRSPPPAKSPSPTDKEKVQIVMQNRYCDPLKRLDLSNFHNDINLIAEGIFFPLYRNPNMAIVVEIITKLIPHLQEIDFSQNKIHSLDELTPIVNHCSELKRITFEKNRIQSIEALDKVSGLAVIELNLENNPLCDKFRDSETYISAVRKRFPKVQNLDGQDLPKAIGFDLEDDVSKLPPNRLSFLGDSQEVSNLVLTFVKEYYKIFDSDDTKSRALLSAAYTENAIYSLTGQFPETGPGSRLTGHYLRTNRNLMKSEDTERRLRTLVRGRDEVIASIMKLPPTTHDLDTFLIDIPFTSPTLVQVVVSGVFRQAADRNPPMRSFMRSMLIVPVGAGVCICNEQVTVSCATIDQIKKCFKPPEVPVPVIAQVAPAIPVVLPVSPQDGAATPVFTPQQMESIQAFMKESGLKPEWTKVCLEENGWELQKAWDKFVALKAEGKIPAEYFQVTPSL